jgi:hypothetical protein
MWTSTDDATGAAAVSYFMQTTEACSNSTVYLSNVIGSNFLRCRPEI